MYALAKIRTEGKTSMRESNFPRKSSYKGPRNRRAAEQLRKKKQRMILGGVGAAAAAALAAAIVFWPEKEEKKMEAVIAETESTDCLLYTSRCV